MIGIVGQLGSLVVKAVEDSLRNVTYSMISANRKSNPTFNV